MTAGLGVMLLMAASLSGLVHCFQPLFSKDSSTHSNITIRAVLIKTFEVCRDIAASEGRNFSLTDYDSLTTDDLKKACSPPGTSTSIVSSFVFQKSIFNMVFSNARVDVVSALSAEHHFDDEAFPGGRDIITSGVLFLKASVKQEDFVVGRRTLGRVCHTLQDFYSHSNWVELKKRAPYGALIRPDQPLEKLADLSTPTCRDCVGGNCEHNILSDVLQQGLLTSGYFNPFSSEKPAGKCSHGGPFDLTSKRAPIGGISKDDIRSSHGDLHKQAATLAESATLELLEDIRIAIGDKSFLRLMGLYQSSVLCFVIDTTASMSDDITEAKRVSFSIIDSKRGTPQEPSAYILVPFNDPGFGPLIRTTNADVFKANIKKLTASGGGDLPEKCLSGLQLALTGAPPSSEIFVFTDAPAKDAALKSTITALIESTKSVVTFMLTDVSASRRRRRGSDPVSSRSLSQANSQLYRDLAQASGGQAIEVAKSGLTAATSVIEDSSATAVVTVIQVVKNPGRPDHFTFTVDGSLRNMTVYVTGASSLTFNLTSSSGVSQNSNQSSGPLASSTTAGNLRRLSLNTDNQTGSWQISVDSNKPYTVKVIGQSSLNFIYYLLEAYEGAHRDFNLKEGRPLSGGNITLLVYVAASNKLNVSEVILFDSSGPTEVNGSIQFIERGNFLVTFGGVPAGNYVVRLKGEDSSATSRSLKSSFQRQASTPITTSIISLTAQANNTNVEPGSTISVRFTVATTNGGVVNTSATDTFTVRANNDRDYNSSLPSTVTAAAGSGGTANGTVTVTVPDGAVSGTDVTLTIVAENAAASDFNYAVLRFSVVSKVTDIAPPVCQVSNTSTNCPSSDSLCSSSHWEFIANFTDGVNGTGIDRITVRKGDGTLNTRTLAGAGGENITVVTYNASCCAQEVELAAVDNVGNVGKCGRQALEPTVGAPTSPPVNVVAFTSVTTGGHTLSMSGCLWITAAVYLLWT